MQCPQCLAEADALTGIETTGQQDRTQALMPCICSSCGTINLLFFPGPVLVRPTPAQLTTLAMSPDYPTLMAVQQSLLKRLQEQHRESPVGGH